MDLSKKLKDVKLADLETVQVGNQADEDPTVADLLDDIVATTLGDPQWRQDAAQQIDAAIPAGPLESFDARIAEQVLQGVAVVLPKKVKEA